MNGITIQGRLFLPSYAPPHAHGSYKARKNGVMLKDRDGQPRVFIVDNRHGERFFVTARRHADGRTRYMFALADTDAAWLGVDGLGYGTELDIAAQAIQAVRGQG